MREMTKACPKAWRAGGQAQHGTAFADNKSRQSDSTTGKADCQELVILWPKRGRLIVAGKLVVAKPLAEFVLAVPYRNRQLVETVSLHPKVLAFARQRGAVAWVVRIDNIAECYRLPLDKIESTAWRSTSEGQPEFFIPIANFERISWQEWAYVEDTITLGDTPPESVARQLELFTNKAAT